jgi:chemotaxis methyl-accepting protein methylase
VPFSFFKKDSKKTPPIVRQELLWQPTRVELITTRFMRNRVLFEDLAHVIVPKLREKKGGGGLRILFAACSTGCEPYTFRFLLGPDTRDEIVAVDLDEAAIETAKKGIYDSGCWTEFGSSAPDLLTGTELQAYFEPPISNGSRQVKESYRRGIDFFAVDLFKSSPLLALESFDLVVCNNLLLHLQPDWAANALRILHGFLTPDGVLVVGGCNPGVRATAARSLNLEPFLPHLTEIHRSWNSVYQAWTRTPRPAWAYPEPDPSDPDYSYLCGQIFFQHGILPRQD